MATDTRPRTLTSVHNYNLRNQGWPRLFSCSPNEGGDGGAIYTDPVSYTFNELGFYPSNADILYYNKIASAVRVASIDTYSPWHLRKYAFGNTPAARGHFIVNAFNRNRTAVSGIASIYDVTRDLELDRPVSVEFYAGRIWYLMPDGRTFFSQTLTELTKAGKAYQDADPTAEDINELVATDGGEIDITGISQALHLLPIRNELAILADNGVWAISGSGDEGFSATTQEIRKITDTGAFGPDTVLSADGTVFYWSEGGIYVLTENEVTGQLSAQNITHSTIQTFYLAIPAVAKKHARGFYDKQSKKILWFYNDLAGYDGLTFKNRYNRVLLFDTLLGAFYTYTLSTVVATDEFITAMIQKKPGSFSTTTENVEDSADVVQDGGDQVTSTVTTQSTSDVKLKLVTFRENAGNWQYAFTEFNDDRMVDFFQVDDVGVNYTSFLETGHDIVGDLIIDKESNIVYTYFKLTEKSIISQPPLVYDKPSSCLMQARWHWADDVISGRWSDQQEAYRLLRHYIPSGTGPFTYGFEVIQTTNQVRGKGHALSLRFDSTDGKDFQLLGWSIPYTALTAP